MIKIFLLTLTCLFFAGCKENTSNHAARAEIGYGKVKDGTYTNKYFNMSINLPTDWALQDNAAQKQLMDQGAEVISGNDKNLKAQIEASKKLTVPMFTLFKFEPGSPVGFNPSIICIAEKISHMPGIKT